MDIFLDNKKVLFAEFLGTFALVLIGAGAVVMDSHTGMSHLGLAEGKVGLVGIALAHGLTLMAMIFALGSISGGHFNPAVSLVCWIRKTLNNQMLLGYMSAQFAGAIFAAMSLAIFFPDEIALSGLGTPALASGVSQIKGFFVEGLITFMLVMTILYATREDNPQGNFAAIAIGLALTGLILFAGAMTGGSANPARYLGPALITLNLGEFFPYIAGEFVGAVVAVFAFNTFQEDSGLLSVQCGNKQGKSDECSSCGSNETAEKDEVPSSALSGLQQVKDTYQEFMKGDREKALGTMKEMLSGFHEYDTDVQSRILTLKMIIEEEVGVLDATNSNKTIQTRNQESIDALIRQKLTK